MQKDTKIYNVAGKNVQFDSISFKEIFAANCKMKNMSVLDYEIELGESLGVSNSAIHSWRFGMNGPSGVELIKQLAVCLEITDYMLLLKDGKGKMTMQISERQKDSLKRVYDAIIEYLDAFQRSDGFNDYWYKLEKQGTNSDYIEDLLYDIAEKEQHNVELVLAKEYIELYKLPVYGQLEEYVYDDLCEIYNRKLSYAYRFEAPVENVDGSRAGVTTKEDYTRALKKINDILEKYM